jgi:sulfur carrier protein ThiS
VKKRTFIGLLAFALCAVLVGTGWAIQRATAPDFHEQQAVLQQMTRDQLNEIGKVARKNLPAVEKQYAQALRSAGQKPARVVARVNGEEVLLSDIERHRAELDKQAKSPVLPFTVTDEMVANEVVRGKVVIAEARERGVLPTQAEINEYVVWQQKLWTEFRNDDGVPDDERAFNEEVWAAYLSGWNVSEDEFWSEIAPQEFARGLVIVNLRNDVLSKIDGFDWGQHDKAHKI